MYTVQYLIVLCVLLLYIHFYFSDALSPAFIHGADLWPHPINFASAEQLQQLQQQVCTAAARMRAAFSRPPF